jgi:hypothetical protein
VVKELDHFMEREFPENVPMPEPGRAEERDQDLKA